MVRPATVEDAEAIAAIYAWYVENSTATFASEPEPADTYAEMAASAKRCLIVKERDGKVIGFAHLNPWKGRCAYAATAETTLYLHHEQRGRGDGQELMKALWAAARDQGYEQLIAISESTGAVGFHLRMGFREVGTLRAVGRKFGKVLDTTIFQKEL